MVITSELFVRSGICFMSKILNNKFFEHEDVVLIAESLLGKVLYTEVDGLVTSGKIVETEAYSFREKACHAYMNRNTNRTKVLFEPAGTSYVYLCYGIHHLFNIVTNKKGKAEAILIRAIEPLEGRETMEARRQLKGYALTSGPGKLSQAMGIDLRFNTSPLGRHQNIWIEEQNLKIEEIATSPRIGVAYAEEDALLPWRFYVKDSKWVSKGRTDYS